MPFDSDVGLLGTGLAPLITATRLLAEGKSVLLLNPERDFFLESSELPLDPLWPLSSSTLAVQRLIRSLPEKTIEELRPDYPGAIEAWPDSAKGGYRDLYAPYVRSRSRLWIQSADTLGRVLGSPNWEAIEDMYVEASDAGINPLVLEGLIAFRRFPGVSAKVSTSEDIRAVMVPRLCDIDVSRYCNGVLEFVRERSEGDRFVCGASQIDLVPGGVKFQFGGAARSARLREGLLVFWTPRLTHWLMAQAKKMEAAVVFPNGVRLWEEWSLLSRDALDPSVVGAIADMTVWAEVEGTPDTKQQMLNRLAVLRAGPLVEDIRQWSDWASSNSFQALSQLCHGFLRWDKFSIRSMRPRAIFEWERPGMAWTLAREELLNTQVICGCDGPLVDVAYAARRAYDFLQYG